MVNNEELLVSVLFLTENGEDDQILNVLKNITEQTHKNIELIISTFRNDISNLIDECSRYFLNIKWACQTPGPDFINKIAERADGEFVFYKTLNNILWYPRHIQTHLEQFEKDNKAKWSLSHVEYRNINSPNTKLSVLGYRIENPPQINKISLDEVVHHRSINSDWTTCLVENNGQTLFYAGKILQQWSSQGRGLIPPEISIIEWVHPERSEQQQTNQDINSLYKQIGIPKNTEIKEDIVEKDGNIEVIKFLPTIVGNKFLDEYSSHIREVYRNTQDITSIAIKRTVGMGDVILVEPIIKKLKQKHPNATIHFYTAKEEIVKYFKTQPDQVTRIEEKELVNDFLFDKLEQVKIDLDLAYESRFEAPFVDSYAEVVDLQFENYKDKYPEFIDIDPLEEFKDKKYVVVCGDGSGWPGKQWDLAKYEEVIKYIQDELKLEVIEPGFVTTKITDNKWNKTSLDNMIRLIKGCEFYIGTDNGPMHVARTLNKPCIIIAGAALPYYSNPNREHIFYIQDNKAPGLGIKHRQFFNMVGDSLTFVPYDKSDPTSGLNNLQPKHVINAIEKLTQKVESVLNKKEMNFYFNIPGKSYYIDKELDFIQAEDTKEHPDQETDISEQYAPRYEEILEKHAKPWVERIIQFKPQTKAIYNDDKTSDQSEKCKLLDVGCSIGCTVKVALDMGFDAYGYDINKPSIEKSHQLFPELKDRIKLGDLSFFIENSDSIQQMKFDVITSDQVWEHVEDPIVWLNYHKSWLEDDGLLFLGVPNFRSKEAQKIWGKWPQTGNGEHTWLPSSKSVDYVLKEAGFDYEHLDDPYESGGFVLKCKKRIENE